MKAVVFADAGGNEVVRLDERPDPLPHGEDVLVRGRYAGLNPADVQQREGRYPAPPELVGAPHLRANGEALANRGRIVVAGVGAGAGADARLGLAALMRKRAVVRGTVLRPRPLEEKAAAVRAFEREVVPGLAVGAIRPLIDSVYAATDFAAAFDRLEGTGKVGKVLLEFG